MPDTSNQPELRQAVTHVGGVEVIAREPAFGPHPHPSKNGAMVEFRDVEKLLLVDGTEIYKCQICPHTGPSTRSVVAHINGTHRQRKPRPKSMYDEKVLRALISAVLQFKGRRGHCELAAEELNRRGVTMLDGKPWTSHNVSHVYNAHKDRFAGVRASRPVGSRSKVAQATAIIAGGKAKATDAASAIAAARQAAQEALTWLDKLDIMVQSGQIGGADPETLRKAQKWDAMRAVMVD